MCDTVIDCRTWVNNQPCGSDKRAEFIVAAVSAIHTGIDHWPFTYEQWQDYVDALRRDYYVGLGI